MGKKITCEGIILASKNMHSKEAIIQPHKLNHGELIGT